jgi:hypothetical protein
VKNFEERKGADYVWVGSVNQHSPIVYWHVSLCIIIMSICFYYIRHTRTLSIIFSEFVRFFQIMWKSMAERGRPQMKIKDVWALHAGQLWLQTNSECIILLLFHCTMFRITLSLWCNTCINRFVSLPPRRSSNTTLAPSKNQPLASSLLKKTFKRG